MTSEMTSLPLCRSSVTSNSNLSDLARKLQQLQTSVGSASSHSMSSVHTAPPLSMPSHPSTPVSLATQPTFSHDLNTQLAGVSAVFPLWCRRRARASVAGWKAGCWCLGSGHSCVLSFMAYCSLFSVLSVA